MKRYSIILSLLITALNLNGQQIPVFNTLYSNYFLLNPAEAGNQDNANAFLHYRQNWLGFADAPQSALFTLNGRIAGDKVGLGVKAFSDQYHIFGISGVALTYSYRIKLTDDQKLGFGLSANFNQNKIYLDRIVAESPDELDFLNNYESGTAFDADFGVVYNFKRFSTGVVVNNLLQSRTLFADREHDNTLTYALLRHYQGYLNYRIQLKKDILFVDPSVVYRSAQGLPLQIDINTVFNYRDQFWIGGGYRLNSGFNLLAGLKGYDKVLIAYSYERNIGNFSQNSTGSHELMIGFLIGQNNTSLGKGGSYDSEALRKIRQETKQTFEKMDQLIYENEKLKKEVEKTNIKVNEYKEEVVKLREIIEKDYDEIRKSIEEQLIIPQDKTTQPRTENDDPKTQTENNKKTAETDTKSISEGGKKDQDAKANNNVIQRTGKEDYYVIVAAFKEFDNAKLGQNIFLREYNLQTNIIQNQNESYYLLYTLKTKDYNMALAEISKLSASKAREFILGHIWVYFENK